MYHRVVESRNEAGKHNIYVYRKSLIKQFEYLKKQGYKTITFKDLKKPDDGSKKIILTFDDGYVDNYNLLFPLLKQYQFTAVIFLVTRQTRNEWGIVEGEPALNLMNEAQVKEMHEYGVEFGGHTRSHVNLAQLSYEDLVDEVAGCKLDVERIINTPIISFCYPFGASSEQVKRVVNEAGYLYGISTKTGPTNMEDDLFKIKRIDISYRTSLSRFRTKVSGYYFKSSFLQRFFNK